MTPAQARLVLREKTRGLVDVAPVAFGSDLAGIVCALRPPPPGAVLPDGMARFEIRLDRAAWEALKVLVDAQFAGRRA